MKRNRQLIIIGILMLTLMMLVLSTLTKTDVSFDDHQLTRVKIGNQEIKVEIVNTAASITKGLSGRAQIGTDGMLFIFPTKRQASFWMKEMKFSLDLIWIKDNQIIQITPDVPAPDQDIYESLLPTYQPDGQVDMVLEVLSGSAQKWGLKPGDRLAFF